MTLPPLRPCPHCGCPVARPRFIEQSFHVVECTACQLVYLGNPPPEERLYENYYHTAGPLPENYRPDSPDPAYREFFAINQQRLSRLRQFKWTGSLLDIGCGRGEFLVTANRQGFRAQGIDVSVQAVAHAREKFNVTAETRTLDEVARAGEKFDAVTLWHTLEHFTDPYTALRSVRTLLAPGGVCLLEVPNLQSLKFTLALKKWANCNHPLYHRTFFTARTLRQALTDTGFNNVQRLRMSYHVPGRNPVYEVVKQGLNLVAMDSFLAFSAS